MNEIWQPIDSLPGYEASDKGRIRHGRRVLSQYIHRASRGAYLRVQVWIDAKRKNRRVNRLVCEAFNGAPPFDDAHARHVDGNAFNNEATNLAWSSATENYVDQWRHGTANLPPDVKELPDWAQNWHNREPKNIRQVKFKNKLKMLERKKRGGAIRP
jgi:hypothetical protein